MKLLQTERGGDITTDFWRAASAGDPLRRMGSPVALRPSPENAAAAVAIIAERWGGISSDFLGFVLVCRCRSPPPHGVAGRVAPVAGKCGGGGRHRPPWTCPEISAKIYFF